MAWFSNHYRCERCDGAWTDEWSSMCDDDCPICGARHMSPHDSDETLLAEGGPAAHPTTGESGDRHWRDPARPSGLQTIFR